MSNVVVSLYCASNRPQYWMHAYKSYRQNNVAFEVVIAGPNKPDFELPPNMKYIYTTVKPMQAYHIAAMHCTGEIMSIIADDCELSPNALDQVYETYKSKNNYKALIGISYYRDNENMQNINGWLFEGPRLFPLATVTFMSKRFYEEVGGMDNRFIAVQGDNEMQVRARLAHGGQFFLCDSAKLWEHPNWAPKTPVRLSHEFHITQDRPLLDSMYTIINGQVTRSTEYPDTHYYINNETLYETSQGEKGRWT